MNEKKAKRTRQLVKHLMAQGAIAGEGWLVHNSNVRIDVKDLVVGKTVDAEGKEQLITKAVRTLTTAPVGSIFGGTVALDPACGRAIYQRMKKATHSHRAS